MSAVTETVTVITEISPQGEYKAEQRLNDDFQELLLARIARGSKSQTTGYP
jgi:hypothetical protein